MKTRIILITCSLVALFLFSCYRDFSINTPLPWEKSTAEEQGLDSEVIQTYLEAVGRGDYGEIHSFLLLRNDFLVVEEYFHGYDHNDHHPVYSVTKSVTSALIGIALQQGKIAALSDPILGYFPQYSASIKNRTAAKEQIDLEDVLTMRGGFEWSEFSYPYGDPRNPVMMMAASSDWYKFVLDLPMANQPGAAFRYNSGCSVLLGGIIKGSCGQQAENFARHYLFKPMQINDYQWENGANGITNTGWGLHLLPRDMAKIGSMYLHKGRWQDQSILSPEWVQASLLSRIYSQSGYGYGYQWWSTSTTVNNEKIYIPFAWGWGGQFIFVIPSLNMVIVSTAGDYLEAIEGALKFIGGFISQAVVS
ncbi:serine hydrolase [candidate division KSB1 bacterium]|nr:serine hydrolase [candidate division KSB1 bacterium]